jgi:hypothetical protein
MKIVSSPNTADANLISNILIEELVMPNIYLTNLIGKYLGSLIIELIPNFGTFINLSVLERFGINIESL